MWVYVFGSLVRGEIDVHSDVDVLAIVHERAQKEDLPASFLKYTVSELKNSFENGDLFAYHLAQESQLVHSDDGTDIIRALGEPTPYPSAQEHIAEFQQIGLEAIKRVRAGTSATIFNYGLIYMALRDVAMILSYYQHSTPSFSKDAPYHVTPELTLSRTSYALLQRCRAASTRGVEINAIYDTVLTPTELEKVEQWFMSSTGEIR